MIPSPLHATTGGPGVTLTDGCAIRTDDASGDTARLLQTWLQAATGWTIPVGAGHGGEAPANSISLETGGHPGPSESYRLTSSPAGVAIQGADPQGTFYGVQSLRLLLPPDALRSAPVAAGGTVETLAVPGADLEDQPAFPWRGVHLDVARHFFPKTWVLRLIDLIALHKFNVLHLHLTDDQGWRIPVDGYPRLVEVGAWRHETTVGDRHEHRYDGIPHGGYYSHADLREIVAYAARRHITIVPEIDMPGHMQAAIAAYPELGNTDEPLEVRTAWGISHQVLNFEPATLEFCRAVIDQVVDLFPGPYVHLGGDECPTEEWEKSPSAQALMARLGLSDERYLQGWFLGEMAKTLAGHGRTFVGWDEIIETGMPDDAVVMSWRNEVAGLFAAGLGHPVVMTPEYWTYFDWAQSHGDDEPVAIRPATDLRRVHAFRPVPEWAGKEAAANIIGAQGQLWTEFVATPAHAEYMYFPRLCALADVVWSGPGPDFAGFLERLDDHLPYLAALDVNYRPPTGPTPAQARRFGRDTSTGGDAAAAGR